MTDDKLVDWIRRSSLRRLAEVATNVRIVDSSLADVFCENVRRDFLRCAF